jgi:hypothetical protein
MQRELQSRMAEAIRPVDGLNFSSGMTKTLSQHHSDQNLGARYNQDGVVQPSLMQQHVEEFPALELPRGDASSDMTAKSSSRHLPQEIPDADNESCDCTGTLQRVLPVVEGEMLPKGLERVKLEKADMKDDINQKSFASINLEGITQLVPSRFFI